MKVKNFFMLAAILLTSVCAMAQSGNNEPLKGDVNGDGIVDAADITAVIKIMRDGGGTVEPTTKYWYVGTEKPTSLSQATVVDEYESSYTFTNSTTERCYVYVLTPSDKTVIMLDAAIGQIAKVVIDVDTTTIPGYKISSTQGRIARGSSVLINVLDDGWKHFYIGTTQPTADNYETLSPAYNSLSDMNGAIAQVPENGKVYVMFPMIDSPDQSQMKRAFTDSEGNIVPCIERTGYFTTVPFHYIWELTFEPGTTLTFKEPVLYYFYIGTTKPTSLSEAWTIASYPAEETFTNPSTTEKCYVYVLTNANKTVNIYDPADPSDALLKAEDTTTINGYKITYLSADGTTPFKIAKGGSVIIKIS